MLRKANAYEALHQATGAGGPAKSGLKAYSRATRLEPTNVQAWLGYARLLEATTEFERAADAYSKVTELDPHKAEAWRHQARMLEIEGEKSKAAEVRAKARAAGVWLPEPPRTIGGRIKETVSRLFESL